ncbi:hypothetical protein Hamer_G026994 [Homarus americanus]|uniref:Uncharacterized protein n=1 Tax=Homarus americanus TaxID=6706 RepID=A0A8J5MS04_HOMAM|nr:hypothetical protein Hamer_G026994 [Homarus americanus]
MKLRAPRRGAGGKVFLRRPKSSAVFIADRNIYDNETLHFRTTSSLPKVIKTRHNRSSPLRESKRLQSTNSANSLQQ